MVTARSRSLAALLAFAAFETACVIGLWFISSAGVEEGMAFGTGRFFALFVGMKALAACLLLMGGMVLAAAGLRALLRALISHRDHSSRGKESHP